MRKLLGLLIFLSLPTQASIYMGAGVGGATAGRNNLAIVIGLNSEDTHVSAFISGLQNSYYYQSDYFLSYNKKIVSSEFLWGSLLGHFGGGIFYSVRGLRTTTSGSTTEEVSDVILGPSLNIRWNLFGATYFAIDAIYGLRNPLMHLVLSFQDVEVLSLGVTF